MVFPKDIYSLLESIVGSEYVSDDPVVCECYTKGGYLYDTLFQRAISRPGCVVLPKDADQIRRIVLLCNRYKIPFKVVSTFWDQACGPKDPEFVKKELDTDIPEAVLLDLKRMNRLEINDRDMYAIVEPGVIYSQLQEEAMKRGLYTLTPGGGAQASVVGNHLTHSYSPLCYRVGLPSRRILGLEWILPDGELVRLGSMALQKDPFWGEGIGPDLRGLLRGVVGWWGHAGIVTKMAVKLFPFVSPERLTPTGITPETALQLPENKMRWYNIQFPTPENLFKAMYEIAKAEIAAAAMKVPVLWRYRAKAKSREHFWEMWKAAEEEIRKNRPNILRVLLIGYTSEKQLQHEERVLNDIVAEFGGSFRRAKPVDESWFKNTDSAGMWWPTGGYVSLEFVFDTLDHSVVRGKTLRDLKESEFTPPTVPEYGEEGWFQVTELGHSSYFEFLIQWDPRLPKGEFMSYEAWIASQRTAIDEKQYTANLGSLSVLGLTGDAYGPNYYSLFRRVKQVLDPNNVADPPFAIHDKLVEKYAPEWMKKYRFKSV